MNEVPLSRSLAVFFLVAALCGCAGSKPANYYILYSVQNPGTEAGPTEMKQDVVIGVGPVKIPEYLDRPQIAVRTANGSLQFAEFDKWAESLEKTIMRVLADNLSIMVPSERVSTYPWPKSMAVRYQVTLEIVGLEKMPDGKVLLDARWNVLGDDGEKLLVMKRSRLSQPVEGPGFDAIAAAESRAVEALSREIANTIRSLPGAAG